MQAIIRPIAYILLLIGLAPFASHAAPALPGSSYDEAERVLSLYPLSEILSSDFEIDDQPLNSSYFSRRQPIHTTGPTLDKRADQTTNTAVFYPDGRPPEWEIWVNDPSLPALPHGEKYILAWMKKGSLIAKGGQGQVFHGTWQGFDEPTSSEKLLEEFPNCEEPAAIKVSPGAAACDNVGEIIKAMSNYVVKVFGYGVERTAPFQYRQKTYREQCVVAYEKLQASGEEMIRRHRDFDRAAMFRALMQGLIDAMDDGLGVINLDVKLDNIMIEDVENRKEHANWKIIDWDIFVHAGPERSRRFAGTRGYVAPEVLHKKEDGFDPEKAMVFTAGMVIYYSLHYRYEEEVTDEMRRVDVHQRFGNQDVRWLWAALMAGRSREQVFEVLPDQYKQGGDLHPWGVFYSRVFCEETRRANIHDMWSALKHLMPAIEELPTPNTGVEIPEYVRSHAPTPKSGESEESSSDISMPDR